MGLFLLQVFLTALHFVLEFTIGFNTVRSLKAFRAAFPQWVGGRSVIQSAPRSHLELLTWVNKRFAFDWIFAKSMWE